MGGRPRDFLRLLLNCTFRLFYFRLKNNMWFFFTFLMYAGKLSSALGQVPGRHLLFPRSV